MSRVPARIARSMFPSLCDILKGVSRHILVEPTNMKISLDLTINNGDSTNKTGDIMGCNGDIMMGKKSGETLTTSHRDVTGLMVGKGNHPKTILNGFKVVKEHGVAIGSVSPACCNAIPGILSAFALAEVPIFGELHILGSRNR